MTNPSRIVGAGLSGLIAAHAWPSVPLVEAQTEPAPHRALLRFRSEAVSHLTGISFKKVLVRKGIWSRGEYRPPTIQLANAYSAKVTGRLIGDRSIWNLDPVERWIAPENFQEQLLNNVGNRVTFEAPDDMRGDKPFISTAPMPAALNALGIEYDALFERSPIDVRRYRVPKCDVHQTVYFPDFNTQLYRASITGDVLILESVATWQGQQSLDLGLRPFENEMTGAFRIALDACEPLGRVSQEYGKIVSLPDAQRKAILFKMTHDHGLYSLGRFATWRNVLLDDIVQDIQVIKNLMGAGDNYALRKKAS